MGIADALEGDLEDKGSEFTTDPSSIVLPSVPPVLPEVRAQHQRLQLQGRIRMRHQKLKVTLLGYILVLTFLAVFQAIGVAIFTQGFLLLRNVLPNIAEPLSNGGIDQSPPVFEKLVVVVIDALRFDFAVPVPESQLPCHNELPFLHELATLQPKNAFLLKFLADPPTTTLQRLKGLTTGSLPTFIDAGLNFDGDAIDEDNLLLQFHRRNKTTAFMGDDTWKALFLQYIDPEMLFAYDSLNVWDLHTVDNGVIEHMEPLLAEKSKWDVLIGHFLGLDHVGHRFGPSHVSAKPKLRQMDQFLRDVVDQIDSKTLLVVFGDHGMDSRGNHGGDSPDEVELTLFMYNKASKFQRQDDNEVYDISDAGKNYRLVDQIDLVPTLSLLMGIPIPFNNLGFPILEAFEDQNSYSKACKSTVEQIERYRNVAGLGNNQEINDLYRQINETELGLLKFQGLAEGYQRQFLAECRAKWAKFDTKLIVIGSLILVASLTFVVTYSRLIPAVRVSTMSFEFLGSAIAMVLLGLVLLVSIQLILSPSGLLMKQTCGIGTSVGIFVGLWAPVMDRFSVAWILHQTSDFFVYNFNGWSTLGLFFIVAHATIYASNSYVVWEDRLVQFFLLTFGFYCLIQCSLKLPKGSSQKTLAIAHTITLIFLTRIASTITVCREEQGDMCSSTFTVSWWSVGLLYVAAFFVPAVLKGFYRLSDSYHSAAPLWIGFGLKFFMMGNAIYWTLDYITSNHVTISESVGSDAVSKLIVTIEPLLSSIKLSIARLSMFFTLILANYSWSRGPLCVKLAQTPEQSVDPDKQIEILGINNVYGSSYLLLLLNFSVPIMLVNQPLGIISICILLVQLLSLYELFVIFKLRDNIIAPTVFLLLAYQHFFSTGHQATIPSIQWHVGFITTESITFPFTHLNVILNTFGPFILVCLAVPLISLWRVPPSSKPITMLAQIVTNLTSVLTYQTVLSVLSFIFAGHFRRHLMVWKIFAPRYMFSGMTLILINVLMVFLALWFGTGKLLTQINRIFGK